MLGAASSSPPSFLCSFVVLVCGFDFFLCKAEIGSVCSGHAKRLWFVIPLREGEQQESSELIGQKDSNSSQLLPKTLRRALVGGLSEL